MSYGTVNYEIKSCVMKEFFILNLFIFVSSWIMKIFSTDCFKSKKFVHVLLIVLCTNMGRMKELLHAFLSPICSSLPQWTVIILFCDIWDSFACDCKNYCLLQCDDAETKRNFFTYRNVLSPCLIQKNIIKMFPKILSFYQTTLCHKPEVSILQFFIFLSVFCPRFIRICNENWNFHCM